MACIVDRVMPRRKGYQQGGHNMTSRHEEQSVYLLTCPFLSRSNRVGMASHIGRVVECGDNKNVDEIGQHLDIGEKVIIR